MTSRFSFCVLAALICMTGITPAASSNTIGDADRDAFRYIHEDMKNGFFDATLPTIQEMGDTDVYLGICTILLAFGNEKMAETGKLAAAAFMESGTIAYSLKKIVGRRRPLSRSERNSFPSGHATLAFTMATVAGHGYPKLRIPLYMAAFGTAFTRVYLGRHYPSDVIVGALIGTLVGIQVTHYRNRILSFSF